MKGLGVVNLHICKMKATISERILLVILFLTTEMFQLSELDKALVVTQSPLSAF